MCFCYVFQEKVFVVHSQSNNIKIELWEERKTLVIEEDKLMDFAFIKGLEPCALDQVFHTIAHKLKKIILFIVCQGLGFHETLPFFGTYEIGPWDIVSSRTQC